MLTELAVRPEISDKAWLLRSIVHRATCALDVQHANDLAGSNPEGTNGEDKVEFSKEVVQSEEELSDHGILKTLLQCGAFIIEITRVGDPTEISLNGLTVEMHDLRNGPTKMSSLRLDLPKDHTMVSEQFTSAINASLGEVNYLHSALIQANPFEN